MLNPSTRTPNNRKGRSSGARFSASPAARRMVAVLMTVDHGCLLVKPKPRPRYTMAQLLAGSDYTQPQPEDQREWVDAPAAGGELL